MSDMEVATKAPESDAQQTLQPSVISDSDSEAETGPSMGDHCTTDRPLPTDVPHQSSGEIVRYDDTEVYISKPADYPSSPGRLLVLLTNGTGVHSVNNQLQADKFAKNGFVVIMPDQFAGDAAPNAVMEAEQHHAGLLEQIKLRVAETAKSFMIDMWLARHTPEKVLPIVQKVIDRAQEDYADAVATGGGIYAAGYCFGAKYVILLAGEHPDAVLHGQASSGPNEDKGTVAKGPIFKAGVVAHPTLVTKEDLKAVKSPLSFACVEHDPLYPEDILEYGRKELATNGIGHEIKTYSAVPHGFAVIGEYESDTIKTAQAQAFQQMLQWLQSH